MVALGLCVPGAFAQPAGASEPGAACGPEWVSHVHEAAGASVAKVEAAGGLGAGFAYHAPGYLATALHVVDTGRPLTVTFGDGRTSGADVVAVDEEHDLAILRLHDNATAVEPLQPTNSPPTVGAPVVAIGHPFGIIDRVDDRMEGLLTWSVTSGVVSARTDRWIQTDAAINPGNSGGPLLDCQGRVVGVVSEKLVSAEGISLAVSVHHLEALRQQIGRLPVYTGKTTFGHFGLGFVTLRGDDTWLGGSLGLGVVHADRWAFRLDTALLWGTTFDDPSPLTRISASGMLAEASVSYRWLLLEHPIPLYLVPGVGGWGFNRTIYREDIALTFSDPGCVEAGEPCATTATSSETKRKEKSFGPFANVGLAFGGLNLSYAFHVDVEEVSSSRHRVLLGLGF